MNWKYVGIIGLVIVSAKLIPSLVRDNPKLMTPEQQAQHLVKVMKPQLPFTVDGTKIYEVYADGYTFIVKKMAMNINSKEMITDPVDIEAMKVEQQAFEKERICSRLETKKYIDSGVHMRSEAYTNDGKLIYALTVRACNI